MTVLKHLVAILLLPVMMTVVVPGLIVASTHSVQIGWSLPWPFNGVLLISGVLFISFGLVLVVRTVTLFATIGRGTLAPWSPTQRLVVQGIYRYVRNPMISGVFGILLGETIWLGSISVTVWFMCFVLANLVYIPWSEEPGLERRFGADYALYKQNVPR